jgi:nanoRNase/pAp phosphatase (c-di-AMP/oligoRNAs hydrolase)
MAKANRGELEQILKGIEGKVLIADHEFSDPDGLASKYIWSFILKEKFGLESDIVYSREMGHHKTQSLAKKFASTYDEQMKNIEDIDLNEYERIMLVDVNTTSSNLPFSEEQIKLLDPKKFIVIDHHKKNTEEYKEVGYEDVDLGYRSVSTLTIDYFKKFDLKFSADNAEHNLLATALWIGFEIDARGKIPYSKDYEALSYIIEQANSSLKEEIERGALPETAYRASRTALANFERFGPYAVTYISELKAEHKDTIAITSEDLLMIQGIEASIAWAMVDKRVVGSVRTTDSISVTAREIAEFYNDLGFKGGGRPNAAGFNGSIGVLEYCLNEDTEYIIKGINNLITSIIKDKAK